MRPKLTPQSFLASLDTKDILAKYIAIIGVGFLVFELDDLELLDPSVTTALVVGLAFTRMAFIVPAEPEEDLAGETCQSDV